MSFLKALTNLFLLPGTLVLNALDISVENDGGVFRSLLNMVFWGALGVMIILPIALR